MKLLWLDLETTGIELDRGHYPLEVGVIVAKDFINPVAEYHAVIKWDAQKTYFQCSSWCQKIHTENHLLYEVEGGTSLADVDDQLCEVVEDNFEKGEEVILAGNSIHFDRGFIEKFLPKFSKKLHYRMLDVTAWRIGFVGAKIYRNVDKSQLSHRVMGDLNASIAEFTKYLGFIKIAKDYFDAENRDY